MHHHLSLSVLMLLSPLLEGARADDSSRLVDAAFLQALREEARRDHPEILAARAREAAAQAAVSAVRLWEDPTAGLTAMAARPPMRREDGDFGITLEQTLPRPKLYDAKRTRALTDVLIREAATQVTTTWLETNAAKTTLELALVDALIGLHQEDLSWLETISVTARDQLADPNSNASSPLRLESEQARKRQTLAELKSQRAAIARRLNVMLGRSQESAWPFLTLPTNPSEAPQVAATLAQLPQRNPELQSLSAMADTARAEVDVAKRERSPVFSLGADTSVYSGGSVRSAGIGVKMTLPWFNGHVYEAAIKKARLEEAAAQREIDAKRRALEEQVIDALTRVQTSADQSRAYERDVIPSADKAAESLAAAWISSKASLLETLEARRVALSARVDERRFMAAHLAALEDLRLLVPPTTSSNF